MGEIFGMEGRIGLIPHKLLFILFWIIAPLYESQAPSRSRHSCARKGMSFHKDTMDLINVIHPTQRPFQLAHQGVFNPTALNRTQDFIFLVLDLHCSPRWIYG